MKTVKEIIEDLQSQYAHYSYWFFKEPDGIWDKIKQVEHDKICMDKHCILKVFKHKRTIIIDDIYNEIRAQTRHISFWFVKGWSEENGKNHNQECQNKHCILITHRKKVTMKRALERGRWKPPKK